MQRFAARHPRPPPGDPPAAARRLWQARRRLSAPGARARPMTPRPFRVTGTPPGDRRHLDARARARRRRPGDGLPPGQFNMLYAFGVGEVPISISGDPSGGGPLEHTVRAVGPVSAAICRAPARRAARRPRPLRQLLAASRRRPAATSSSSPAASAWRRCARPSSRRSRGASELAGVVLLYGGRTPADAALPRRARGAGAGPAARPRGHRRQRRERLARHVGVVTTLIDDADFDPLARGRVHRAGPR